MKENDLNDRYKSLTIPVISKPFATRYKEIEESIYKKLNELLDKKQEDKDLPREYLFNEELSNEINQTISQLESKDRLVCPFLRTAQKRYEELEKYGAEQRETIFKAELPKLKEEHSKKIEKNPSAYPFPEFLKADIEEILNVIHAIRILHEVYNHTDRLDLEVKVIKEATNIDFTNYHGIDISKGFGKTELYKEILKAFPKAFTSNRIDGLKNLVREKSPNIWPEDKKLLNRETCMKIIDIVKDKYK